MEPGAFPSKSIHLVNRRCQMWVGVEWKRQESPDTDSWGHDTNNNVDVM